MKEFVYRRLKMYDMSASALALCSYYAGIKGKFKDLRKEAEQLRRIYYSQKT